VLWFGLISVVLLVVWAMTGADYLWPVWPILGFLIAIGWQAFAVYGPGAVDDRRPPGAPEPPSGPARTMPGGRRVLPLGRSFSL